MANSVNEAVSGIHEIHSNASYAIEEKRLDRYVQHLYDILKRLFIIKYGIKFANNLFQSIGPILLFLVGGYLAINGHFTLGALVAFLSAYEKVYDPWKEMLEYYQALQDARVRYRQIMKIFDLPPPHPVLPPGREILQLSGSMNIDKAEFTVSGGIKLLEDVSMQVQPGEMVALVGSSGSGKSTLALLIAQLYDLSSGSIRYDGHEIGSLCKADISHNITMIAQHPFIFTGTVKENLLYSARSVCNKPCDLPEDEKIYEIIDNVGLEDDFLHFGLNMVMPKDEVRDHEHKILQIRQLVREYVHEHYLDDIEFFDVRKFLEHSCLLDNLIFGESVDDTYSISSIVDHNGFLSLLKMFELDHELENIGLEIARATIDLIHQKEDHEFLFQVSPMEEKDLDSYTRLLHSLSDGKLKRKKERNAFLVLALGFIPVQHTLITIESDFKEKIIQARHYFLQKEIGIGISKWSDMTDKLEQYAVKEDPNLQGSQKEYRPFYPSRYIRNHSLLTNILFGTFKYGLQKSRILEKQIIEILRPAGLLDEIKAQGLNFEVGSKGDRLSGGQQQKLAIARAFLKGTPILIMDEATASLDNTSQALVQKFLETKYKGRKTIIAVIHRLDLAPSFDRIIVLQEGAIVEQGTYDDLLAEKGFFHSLVKGET